MSSRRLALVPVALLCLAARSAHALPDLAVTAVDGTDLSWDCHDAAVTGNVTVTVANAGTTSATVTTTALAFEDRDLDGAFSPSVDVSLGESAVPPLAAGQLAGVTVPVSGTMSFAGAPVTVLVDSRNVVAEDESNNLGTTAWGSVRAPGGIDTTLALAREDVFTSVVTEGPYVAHLHDDNEDGKYDSGDHADYVVILYGGAVAAVRADTGDVLWSTASGTFNHNSDLAIGDLDGDGVPEVVGINWFGNGLVALRYDGTEKRRTPAEDAHSLPPSHVSIGNVDGQGNCEVVVGATIFSSNLRWIANGHDLGGSTGFNDAQLTSSCLADVDGDGQLDIVAGGTIYAWTGQTGMVIEHQVEDLDGSCAVADLDDDPAGEIIVVNHDVRRLDLTSTGLSVTWTVTHPDTGDSRPGGAPTIAELDGDAPPEIGIGFTSHYIVLDASGTELWRRTIADTSSGECSAAAFDIDADGDQELLFRDETTLFLFDGATGESLDEAPVHSGTRFEEPVVADVDDDGHAEVLISHGGSESEPHESVLVFQSPSDDWAPAREIWNEHGYHVTNVGDDLRVPRHEHPSWLYPVGAPYNDYRAQHAPPGLPALAAPNLTVSLVAATEGPCESEITVSGRVGNAGSLVAPPVSVALYADSVDPGHLLDVVELTGPLASGQSTNVEFTVPEPASKTLFWIVADDDGTGGSIAEGSEGDNACFALADTSCPTLPDAREAALRIATDPALTGDYDDPFEFAAVLTDEETSAPISRVFVTFTLDDATNSCTTTCKALTDSDGRAACWLTPTCASRDTVVIAATSDATSLYAAAEDEAHFYVNLEDTTLSLDSPTVQPLGTVTLSATLREDGGTPIEGETLEFALDGGTPLTATTGSDGRAILEIDAGGVAPDDHDVGVSFDDTLKYEGSSDEGTLHTLARQFVATPLYQVFEYAEGERELTVTMLDDSGNREGYDVKVRLDVGSVNSSATITCDPTDCKTDADGQVSPTYTSENAGGDAITVFLDLNGNGDQDAGEPEQTGIKNLGLKHAYIEWTGDYSGTAGQPSMLGAVLRDADTDAVLDGYPMKLSLGDETCTALVDDTYCVVTSTAEPGDLVYTAEWAGDSEYGSVSWNSVVDASETFELAPKRTDLRIVPDTTQVAADTVKVRVRLRESGVIDMEGQNVTLTGFGTTPDPTGETGSDGIATITAPGVDPGEYDVTAHFAASGEYAAADPVLFHVTVDDVDYPIVDVEAPDVPDRVEAPVVAGWSGAEAVTWDPPANAEDADVSGYLILATTGDDVLVSPTDTPWRFVTGLGAGADVRFRVVAVNVMTDVDLDEEACGSGTVHYCSDEFTVLPNAAGPPQNLTATVDVGTITLNWDEPLDTDACPIDSYHVFSVTADHAEFVDEPPFEFGSAAEGIPCIFRVAAHDCRGYDGIAASVTVTVTSPPSAPDPVTAIPTPEGVRVYWTQPADLHGSPIEEYHVTADVEGETGPREPVSVGGDVVWALLTDLPAGSTAHITVAARNAAPDWGADSEPFELLVIGPPAAPDAAEAVRLSGAASAEWHASSDDHGSALLGYLVTAGDVVGALPADAERLSRVVTGLTNGDGTSVSVKAVNAFGASQAADAGTVTPAREPDPPPDAPTIDIATGGTITVGWTAPSVTGGSAITGYVITTSPPSGDHGPYSGASHELTELAKGQEYVAFVHAVNAVGGGEDSPASEPFTFATKPEPPRAVTAFVAGDRAIRVSWLAPVDNGGLPIDHYTITSDHGIDEENVPALSRMRIIRDDLTPGVTHVITVTAHNARDNSDGADSDPVTVATFPGQPTVGVPTPGNATAHVTWSAPTTDGHSDLIAYKVCALPADADCIEVPPDTTEADFTDLANGTAYTFTVQARNAIGVGLPGTNTTVTTPCGAPSQPLSVHARVTGIGELTVEWAEPAFDGGCPILTYELQTNDGSWVDLDSTDLTKMVPSLTVGTAYHFAVRATNTADTGPPSTASTAVKAATIPSPPLHATWEPGDGVGRACWAPPDDDGGSPVTGYDVLVEPGDITGHADAPDTCALVVLATCPEEYTFTAIATNDAGPSEPSDESDPAGDCGRASHVEIDIPEHVAIDQTVHGTVFLDRLTGDSGEDVDLDELTGGLVTITSPVHVPAHERFAVFPIAGVDLGTETITASFASDSDDGSIEVTDDDIPAGGGPFVKIESPGDGDAVTAYATPVVVTVHGDSSVEWTLRMRPADGTEDDWETLASDDTQETHAQVATIDPTLLLNGQIELELSATDSGGTSTDDVHAVVSGAQKIGNFSVSFVDMTVAISGLPIQIVRTYDSRNHRVSDFGLGWTLSTTSVKLEVNRPIGEEWRKADYTNPLFPYTPRFCNEERRSHVVTVTFPDGKVEQFAPILETAMLHGQSCSLLGPDHGWVRFVPVGGTTRAKLEVAEVVNQGSRTDAAEADIDDGSGVLMAGHGIGDDVFDPISYVLTTQEGVRYTFVRTATGPPQSFKLTTMEDRNGNTLTFGTVGSAQTITAAPSGQVVRIERSGGRITAICDPFIDADGYHSECNSYGYGEVNPGAVPVLTAYHDRSQTSGPGTTFHYRSGSHHLLDGITDALDHHASWSCYDGDDRLVAVCDGDAGESASSVCSTLPEGHCVDLSTRDLSGFTQTITDPRNDSTTVLTYDDRGNVTDKVDAMGQHWQYAYAGDDDQVTEETDPLDRVTDTAYENGRQTAVTVHPDLDNPTVELVTSYTYTDDGDLETMAQPGPGGTWTYHHDAHGNLLSERGPDGKGSDYLPDDSGNVTQVTDALQHVVSTSHYAYGVVRDETDASGVVTTYDYVVNPGDLPEYRREDPNGNPHVVTRTDHDGDVISTTTYEYDLEGRPTKTTHSDGSATKTVYDAAGRRSKEQELVSLGDDPDSPSDDVWRETGTFYDESGRVHWIQHADETYEEFSYDAEGNRVFARSRTKYTHWDDDTGPTRDTSSLSIVTQTEYDKLNRPVKTCVGADVDMETNAGEWEAGCTWTHYDPAGQVTWRRDERGVLSVSEFDGAGRVVKSCGPWFPDPAPEEDAELTCGTRTDITETDYDDAGRAFRTIDPLGVRSTSLFDAAGRVVAECRSLASSAEPENLDDAVHAQTHDDDGVTCKTMVHDDLGRVTAETDRNGTTTHYAFDTAGRLHSVTDALSHVTTYVYNDSGNMTEQHDALERVTHYEYDPATGRRTARVLPLGQRETFHYGISGAMDEHVDFMGRATAHVEDEATGRETERHFPTDPQVTTDYWPDGQRHHVIIDDGETVTSEREPDHGWLSRVDHSAGTDIAYTHDRAGNRNSITTDPDEVQGDSWTVTYDFDAAGRLAKVWDGFSRSDPFATGDPDCAAGPSEECHRVEYAYDDAGRMTSVTYEDGDGHPQVHGIYANDALTGGLLSITWEGSDDYGVHWSPLLKIEYDFDIGSEHHGLDEEGRRQAMKDTWWDDRTRTVLYGFDALYRLTSEDCDYSSGAGDDYTIAYIYDDVGNRLSETRTGPGAGIVTSDYDDDDRLQVAGTTTFGWNENGDMAWKSGPDGTTTYGWDEQDRLVHAETPDDVLDFVYDADGIKQAETVNGTTTREVVDGTFAHDEVLEERGEAGLLARYTRGTQIVMHAVDGGSWYLSDRLGSTRALVSVTTPPSVLGQHDFDGFGVERTAGTPGTTWLFAGERREQELSMDYLRHRWVEPARGLFLQIDPLAGPLVAPISRTSYTYASLDPVNGTDPSGEYTLPELVVAVGVLSAVAVVGVSAYSQYQNAIGGPDYRSFASGANIHGMALVVFDAGGQTVPGTFRSALELATDLDCHGYSVRYWRYGAPVPSGKDIRGHYAAIFCLGHHGAHFGMQRARDLMGRQISAEHFLTGECGGSSFRAQRAMLDEIYETGIANHVWGPTYGELYAAWPDLPHDLWGGYDPPRNFTHGAHVVGNDPPNEPAHRSE